MKTIGLIGGMSWESTVTYYQLINEEINQKLGGLHSARLILYSVDFDEIEKCQSSGQWEKSGEILAQAAISLEKGGADMILIGTNTMHKVYGQIQDAVHVPVIHIADATADALEKDHIRKVGLLGTEYTMTQDFYKQRLIDRGMEVIIPHKEEIKTVNDIIFKELCHGIILPESRSIYQNIILEMQKEGAQGVILGCTEIGLLIRQKDVSIPVYDTTVIHAQKAVELALGQD